MRKSPYPVAVAGLTATVFGWSLYRATTLTLTHDEAITCLRFVAWGPARIYDPRWYDANNHVLYSLLAWVSTSLFGFGELPLRLPAVLAGGFVVIAAGRLFRLLAGPTPLAFAGVLAVVLNPLVMDFLVAARGYGLGLGFSLWAWGSLIRAVQSGDRRPLVSAGVCQGLAVGANLVFVYPNAALALVFLGLLLVRDRGQLSRSAKKLVLCYILPGAVTAAVLCVPIFRHLGGEHFYYGTETPVEAAESIVGPSLHPVAERGWFGTPGTFPDRLTRPVSVAVLAALGLTVGLGLRATLGRRGESGREIDGLFFGGSVVLLVLLGVIRGLTHMPYPQDRTGIYFIPLAAGCVVRLLNRWPRAGFAGTVILSVLAVHFASQVQARFFYLWRYDAGTGRVYRLLDARAAARPGLTVGHDWRFEPALNYYNWLTPSARFAGFDRRGPGGDYDLYYLEASTWDEWRPRGGYRVVHEDPVSKAVVVERDRP